MLTSFARQGHRHSELNKKNALGGKHINRIILYFIILNNFTTSVTFKEIISSIILRYNFEALH